MSASASARRTQQKARREARRAARKLEKKAANPWFERATRLGYVIRGLLYGLVGVLAIGQALGFGGQATDMRGGVAAVTDNPLRYPILAIALVGLLAYSAWGFVRAVYDPLHRGDDPVGLAARLGFVWSGISYLSLTVFLLQLGAGRAAHDEMLRTFVASALQYPAGRWIAAAAGAVCVAFGAGQFVDTVKASFRKDLKRGAMTRWQRLAAEYLGRFGMLSRGVIFTMLGCFVVLAALTQNPEQARGWGSVFGVLAAQPHGQVLLVVVALGFVALGLHSFACARWIRTLE
jgi:uncharacterized protein DUF1206